MWGLSDPTWYIAAAIGGLFTVLYGVRNGKKIVTGISLIFAAVGVVGIMRILLITPEAPSVQ
jgi:hypothetical protein